MSGAVDTLVCPQISCSSPELSWDLAAALDSALEMPLRYLLGPQELFLPASVRVGWHEGRLLVLATMEDAAVHSNATADGQDMWELGDVFEIFLRDQGMDEYFELHTSPDAYRLQLGFPSALAFADLRRGIGKLVDYKMTGDTLSSLTRRTAKGWQALCAVQWPQASMEGRGALVSFSRYDYTRDREVPVLSSTSRHHVVDFHRQEDWTPIVFAA